MSSHTDPGDPPAWVQSAGTFVNWAKNLQTAYENGMNLRILGPATETSAPAYRGTYRTTPLWVLQPLLHLTKHFFQPRLDRSGLFDGYDTARFCLECMLTMQHFRPMLWENEEERFDVVGIWRVLPQ